MKILVKDEEQMNVICPFKPGDVIWYVYGQPGYNTIHRMVLLVHGTQYIAYDPFLDRSVTCLWHRKTGHSIGDSDWAGERFVSKSDLELFQKVAEQNNIRVNFRANKPS